MHSRGDLSHRCGAKAYGTECQLSLQPAAALSLPLFSPFCTSFFGTSPFFSQMLQSAGISKDSTITLKFWSGTRCASCAAYSPQRIPHASFRQVRRIWRRLGHCVQQSVRRCSVARSEHNGLQCRSLQVRLHARLPRLFVTLPQVQHGTALGCSHFADRRRGCSFPRLSCQGSPRPPSPSLVQIVHIISQVLRLGPGGGIMMGGFELAKSIMQ